MTHRLLAGLEKKGCDAKRWCTTKKTSAILFLFGTAKLLSKIPEACSNGSYPKCNPKDAKSNTRTNGSSECRGWVMHPWNLRCVCFSLGEPAPTKTSKFTFQAGAPEVAPVVLWEKPPKPAGWSAIWEALMEDKWPDKKRGGGLLQWYGIFLPNGQVLPPPPPPPFGQDGFST